MSLYSSIGSVVPTGMSVMGQGLSQPGMVSTLGNPISHTAVTTLVDMIRMRLCIPPYGNPWQFLECFCGTDNQVHVFMVTDNKPITLTEPWDLFPSDTLITQLRLLVGDK